MKAYTVLPITIALFSMILLCSCEKPEPIQLGFVGDMSGRVADLGISGRNGVQLAVEQRNAAGGINGRTLQLVVRDDEQDARTVKRVVEELIDQKIELIIGPMTSGMAMAVVPRVNQSKSILLSPTVTTTELLGLDDHFLRVISSTREYAAKIAQYQAEKLGIKKVAVIYDLRNRSYTESWLDEFRRIFSSLGGEILLAKGFASGPDMVFLPLVEELLAVRPESILIISNAVDSALICQQIRKLAPQQNIVMSEWASTERFLELAGSAAEGVVVSQFLDRKSSSPEYLNFIAAYRERFHQEPGFAGVAGYDAALIALEALAERRSGENLKDVILKMGEFQGLQQKLHLDRFGDADRRTFVTRVQDRQYLTVE